MSPRIIISRLEIGFWNTVIPLMEESPSIRYIVAWSYRIATKMPSTKMILIGLVSIVAGGSLGFLFGILNQFL